MAKALAIWHSSEQQHQPAGTTGEDASTYKLEPEQHKLAWKLLELYRLVPTVQRKTVGVVCEELVEQGSLAFFIAVDPKMPKISIFFFPVSVLFSAIPANAILSICSALPFLSLRFPCCVLEFVLSSLMAQMNCKPKRLTKILGT